MSKYARKTDGNQAEIVAALTAAGYTVEDCSRFGQGFPDLMVGSKAGVLVLIEVKTPKGKFTKPESAFFCRWEGFPVYIARNVSAALDIMAAYDEL